MTSTSTTPSPGDMKLFYYVLKHCKTKPDVDWSAVAGDCNFKNAEVAKTRYGQVRRKLESSLINGGVGTGSSPATKATPNKSSGVKKSAGRVGSKGKTPKRTAAARMLADEFADDDEDDFPESPMKVKHETAIKTESGGLAAAVPNAAWARELEHEDGQPKSLFG